MLGDSFESGLDTRLSRSVNVDDAVALERTLDATDVRLAVDTTLRATLRTEAAEEETGCVVCLAIFLLSTLARSE